MEGVVLGLIRAIWRLRGVQYLEKRSRGTPYGERTGYHLGSAMFGDVCDLTP